MEIENQCVMCVTYVPIVGAMCSQCVIDEVDMKLEKLFNRVNLTSSLSWKLDYERVQKKLIKEILAIREELHSLVSPVMDPKRKVSQ